VTYLLSLWLGWRVFVGLAVAGVIALMAGRQFGILLMPVVAASAYQATLLLMEERHAS
jgi:hypothetical protein